MEELITLKQQVMQAYEELQRLILIDGEKARESDDARKAHYESRCRFEQLKGNYITAALIGIPKVE